MLITYIKKLKHLSILLSCYYFMLSVLITFFLNPRIIDWTTNEAGEKNENLHLLIYTHWSIFLSLGGGLAILILIKDIFLEGKLLSTINIVAIVIAPILPILYLFLIDIVHLPIK